MSHRGATPARVSGPAGARSTTALVLVGVVGALSLAMMTAMPNPVAAFVPLVLVCLVWAVWALPIRYTFYVLTGLVLVADVFVADPAIPYIEWQSPVAVLRDLFIENLNGVTGIPALSLSGAELAILLLLVLASLRALAGMRRDAFARLPTALPIAATLVCLTLAVLGLAAWGLFRGGDLRQGFWQFRYLLALGAITGVAALSLRGTRDFVAIGLVVTAAATAKVAIGLHYYLLYVRFQGAKPATVTGHHDTVLFVVVLAVWGAAYLHRRTPRQLIATLTIVAVMMTGIVINNRRTAYVSIAFAAAAIFVMQPVRPRRKAYRLLLKATPLLAMYVYAGNYKKTGVFGPAASIVSLFNQDDGSNSTRDIENWNLIQTVKAHKLIGSGWGHMYAETSVAYDISGVFVQYRYIAHNGVLWLWSIGGLIGFTALWSFIGVGIFLAARGYARAETPDGRTSACAAVAIYATLVVQTWADMGMQSWATMFLVAIAAAMSGKLAAATGGWPVDVRRFLHHGGTLAPTRP